MKITPILYSAAMARAKVAGIKTQTRRIVKPQPDGPTLSLAITSRDRSPRVIALKDGMFSIFCPYGQPGDVLYGKESFYISGYAKRDNGYRVEGSYTADGLMFIKTLTRDESAKFDKWTRKIGGQSSLFMFRSLSRIVDEIVEVRVERLQDISEVDAHAEGLPLEWLDTALGREGLIPVYRQLWESINGPGSWENNPWVWVIVTKHFEGALPS